MAERHKRTERVALNLTEDELLALSRLATFDERALGEYLIVRVIRPYLFGNSRRSNEESNESSSAFGDLRVTT